MAKPEGSIIILDDDEDDEDKEMLEGSSPESCSNPTSSRSQQEVSPTSTPGAQTNGAGKQLGVTREGTSSLKMENQKLFAEFVEFCSQLTLEHPEVIPYLKGRQQKTSPKFLSSTEFRNVIGRCLTRVQNKKSKVYVYINELCTVFKAHSEKKKVALSTTPSAPLSAADPATEVDPAAEQPAEVTEKRQTGSRRQIRYLENLLKMYTAEIRRLQEKELDLEEMDDQDSTYIQENRLKRKMMRIFDKLCELKKCCSLTGRVIEQRIPYRGTRYPEVNRRVEKFINKPDNFPDYGDILKVIQKTSIRHGLGLAKKQMQSMAQDAFREVGNRLQERRHLDMIYNFGSHLTDEYKPGFDPALSDPILARRLRENRSMAVSSLTNVIKKYAEMQDENEEEERRKKRERTLRAAADSRELASRDQSSTTSEDVRSPASERESELEEDEEEEEDSSDTDIEEELKNCQQASDAEEEEGETPEDEPMSEITEGDQQMDNQPLPFSSAGDDDIDDDDDDEDDDDEVEEEEEEEEEEGCLDNHSKDHEEDANCGDSQKEEARLETPKSQNEEAMEQRESSEDTRLETPELSGPLDSSETVMAHETEPESLPFPDSDSLKTESSTQEFVLDVEPLPLDSSESQSPKALSKAMSPGSLDPFTDSGCIEMALAATSTSPALSPRSQVVFPDPQLKSSASQDPADSGETSLAPADYQAAPPSHSMSPDHQAAFPCHINNSSVSLPPQMVSSGSQVSEKDTSIEKTSVSSCTRTEFPLDTNEDTSRMQEKMPQESAGESRASPAKLIESIAVASLDTLAVKVSSLAPERTPFSGGSREASPQILERHLLEEGTREAVPQIPERPLSAEGFRKTPPKVPERPLSVDGCRLYSGPEKSSMALCHKKRTLSRSCSPPASCKEASSSPLENGSPINTNLNGRPGSSVHQTCQPHKRLRREEDESYSYEQIQSIDSGEKAADLSLDVQVACESPAVLLDSSLHSPVSNSQHSSPRQKKLAKINAATQCDPEEIIVLSDSE
ncbi:death domain-associated protein 6 isoform X2 [Microcaecilia unicolor]|uniref:Death domain-associated protein 6 n=1 Tax=Microcaecilia unicolor TaxID=1415580 RepID=A0A6P7XKN5_9AMPH|nr:death domain-associated protein 6 isoform X2 [Microcaecilia unicolor]